MPKQITIMCSDYRSHWMSYQCHHMHISYFYPPCHSSGREGICDFAPLLKRIWSAMPSSKTHLPTTLRWINTKCYMVGRRRTAGLIDSFTELTKKKTKFERLGPHEEGEEKELTALSSFQGKWLKISTWRPFIFKTSLHTPVLKSSYLIQSVAVWNDSLFHQQSEEGTMKASKKI